MKKRVSESGKIEITKINKFQIDDIVSVKGSLLCPDFEGGFVNMIIRYMSATHVFLEFETPPDPGSEIPLEFEIAIDDLESERTPDSIELNKGDIIEGRWNMYRKTAWWLGTFDSIVENRNRQQYKVKWLDGTPYYNKGNIDTALLYHNRKRLHRRQDEKHDECCPCMKNAE